MNKLMARETMSSGGRLILVNSCLSNIPNYVMDFYNLTDGQHKELDSIRGMFFWQGGRESCLEGGE
jgi:hypothetical protein